MTKGFSPIGELPLCSVCKTGICHPVTGICLTCKLEKVGSEIAESKLPSEGDTSTSEFMSLIKESHCKTEMHIRIACPPVPEDDEMIFSYEEVKYHIGWRGKPRIRIPCFLAGRLKRFNCVFTEYVDCRVVEEAVVDVNKSPSEIASEIADDFYPITSLQHADLRRRIIEAIETERTAQAAGNPHRGTIDISEPATYQGPPRIKDQ